MKAGARNWASHERWKRISQARRMRRLEQWAEVASVGDVEAFVQAQTRAQLDACRAPGPVRTLADMTEDEIAALERRYGVPVRRPPRKAA